MAALIYSSENDGFFPPRNSVPRWTTLLQRYYSDLDVLRCPGDGPNPMTFGGPNPADQAPRSYMFNGFIDYFAGLPRGPDALPESAILYPAATVLFGEKRTESGHFWMDYGFAGGDIEELEQGRHFRANPSQPSSGGSNYAMADGGVQFFKFGDSVSPTNLWCVVEECRTSSVIFP
jgi:prepilin-type processing-associated H-X9-DG protein